MNIAIVTVGYNRKDSLQRLLFSLNDAEYLDDSVDLIISLDKSNKETEIIEMVNSFCWNFGSKRVRTFPIRQGLKSHILQCGDLTKDYDAVIVLEDDLIVSKGFYSYVKQCVDFYADDDRIAGISLYSFQLVPGCLRPFVPSYSGYDVFFMSFAQSWGQCWTRKMWMNFKSWYLAQSNSLTSDGVIPDFIANWDDKSWLKYYMKYTAERGLYFVYPYVSLTTNFTESGVHNSLANSHFQVPLLNNAIEYRFPPKGKEIMYDSFMERVFTDAYSFPNLSGKVIIDLYGMKTSFGNSDYLISTKNRPFYVVQQLGLCLRPQEENIIRWCQGKGIYVYDLKRSCKKNRSFDSSVLMKYDFRAFSWKKSLNYTLSEFASAVKRKINC